MSNPRPLLLIMGVVSALGAARALNGADPAPPARAGGVAPVYDANIVEQRLAVFRRELDSARDPVAVATRMADDPVAICSLAGMDALVLHWSDARSAEVLERLSAAEPKVLRDGLPTRAGLAYERLQMVRARRTLRGLLEGHGSRAEQTRAIVEFLARHPDLLHDNRAVEKFYLVRGLADDLKGDPSPAAVEAVVKLGFADAEYVRQHAEAAFSYATRLTDAEALANPALVEAIADSGDARALGLLERWLPHSLSDGQRSFINSSIRKLRGG